jgi:hypothetical protein
LSNFREKKCNFTKGPIIFFISSRIFWERVGNSADLMKVRRGRGTRVALSAPHSSTLVEETLLLLRSLHRLPAWSARINALISLKLSHVREIITEIPILQMMHQEGENFTAQQSAVISCLALMGGFDGRPRIGGLVSLEEGGSSGGGNSDATTARAVVCGVTRHGKLAVQLLGDSRQRKVRGRSRNQFRVFKIILTFFVVAVDPHSDWIRILWGPWIQEGKNDPQL